MLHKFLTLLLTLLALVPQQICTCVRASESCRSEVINSVSFDEHAHHCDGHDHDSLNPTVPVVPDHEHESDCLISQPLPPTVVEKATTAFDLDIFGLVLFDDFTLLDLNAPRLALNPDSAFLASSPHVPLFVSFCNFRI